MTDYNDRFRHLETDLVHAGSPQPRIEGAVVTPLFQSANYLMADESAYDALRYIRLSNSPTHLALHARLAAIEKGEAALVTASGMAAMTSSVLAFAGNGDHLLAQRTLYGGTQSFLDEEAVDFGLSVTAIDLADAEGPRAWERALRETTRVILVEAISNPLMEVGDLRALVVFARRHGLLTIIDSTFATPINFRPLEVGFDLVVHSATKYLNGHSDVVAGAVVGSSENVQRVRQRMIHLGGSLDPHACFLFDRGLKTLAVRVQRQNESAMRLAIFLEGRKEVTRVNYPGLPSDPGHPHARDLFSGFGGMLSFYLESVELTESFLDRLRIPLHAPSLGGVETLVVRPAKSSHLGQTPEQRQQLGITDDLVRVSVGIEQIDELMEDFGQALDGAV